jgi:hypothetical protein
VRIFGKYFEAYEGNVRIIKHKVGNALDRIAWLIKI